MTPLTIRLYDDTIRHIEEAADFVGVGKSTFIRHRLEQIFDGTPYNPLGFVATPAFYDHLTEAIAIINVSRHSLNDIQEELVKRRTKRIRGMIEVNY